MGHHLVISHLIAETSRDMATVRDVHQRGGIEMTLRSREQVEASFAEFELVEPGVVPVSLWRPDSDTDDPEPPPVWAGVGRKR
jgi:hypothetical protein